MRGDHGDGGSHGGMVEEQVRGVVHGWRGGCRSAEMGDMGSFSGDLQGMERRNSCGWVLKEDVTVHGCTRPGLVRPEGR